MAVLSILRQRALYSRILLNRQKHILSWWLLRLVLADAKIAQVGQRVLERIILMANPLCLHSGYIMGCLTSAIYKLCRIHQYLLSGLRVLVANYISVVSHFILHAQLGKIRHGGYLLNMLGLLESDPWSTSRAALLGRELRRTLLFREQSWGVLSIFSSCLIHNLWSLRKRIVHLNILLILIPLRFWYA